MKPPRRATCAPRHGIQFSFFIKPIAKALKKRSAPVVPAPCRRKRHPSAQTSIRLRLELQAENNEISQLVQWEK
jgi:hypothetical protein